MKVIDLLNKIANGEEVPIFRYEGHRYKYSEATEMFDDLDDDERCKSEIYFGELNDEVEIIEEDKKIETITTFYDNDLEEYIAETKINGNRIKERYGSPFEQMIIEKIKEIIEEINKLKEGKDE